MNHLRVSVIIPSYNEMQNLRRGVLEHICDYFSHQPYEVEIIVVDDGSTDGSVDAVRQSAGKDDRIILIANRHTGKAGAVTTGTLAATGDCVLFTDMDQATPIEELSKLLPCIATGYDVVIGSRTTRQNSPWTRRAISAIQIFLRSKIIGLTAVHDTQCGFKLFTTHAAHDIFPRVQKAHRGFNTIRRPSVTPGFDVELLYVAQNLGYRIKEIPVSWTHVESKRVRATRDSIDGFFSLIQIRHNIRKRLYD